MLNGTGKPFVEAGASFENEQPVVKNF